MPAIGIAVEVVVTTWPPVVAVNGSESVSVGIGMVSEPTSDRPDVSGATKVPRSVVTESPCFIVVAGIAMAVETVIGELS